MYENPVRKVKPSKIKTNLMVKDNNNRQVRKLPGSITPNMVGPSNPGMIINGSLKDLTTIRGYKNQNTINQ